MGKIIKFPTLENGEVHISIEDAQYISLESMTVASILDGKMREEDYADIRYGGVAITLALEYCRKLGEINHRSSQPSESKSDAINIFAASNIFASLEVETKCKEVDKEAWVDDFIVRITSFGLGMVHELLVVSRFLLASGLIDLTCQCIFDYLTFKDYRDFRKAFAFQFLFPPCFGSEELRNIENVLECIYVLPTLDEIHAEFKNKIPFTPDELELAESENRSLRVGGNLEYKTNKRSIEELLIKVEYMLRRLNSFLLLSYWIDNAVSKCFTKTFAYLKRYLDDQSNNDIRQLCSTFHEPASTCLLDIIGQPYEGAIAQKIYNPSRSYEDINVIKDDMDKIELEMAAEANVHKRKAEELCEACYTNWQNDRPHHKDKAFPHLTYFLENRYQEIFWALCNLRGWMTAHEVQYHFNKLNVCNKTTLEYAYDQLGDHDENVESEEENEDNKEDEGSEEQSEDCYEDEGNEEQSEDFHEDGGNEEENEDYNEDEGSEEESEDSNEDEGSEVLLSQESEADRQIRNGVVAAMRRLTGVAVVTIREITHTYEHFHKLQIEMRMLVHLNLLLKDEKILAFICKEKFNLYMRASKQGTASRISFAENKEEFDRIMEETDQKFGDRGPVIEEAKKKYFQHYRKFHYAMVDETKRQMELNSKYVNGSQDIVSTKHAG